MNTTTAQLSPAEEFAQETRALVVPNMLKTIRETKHLALFIVLAVMTVSYQHMRQFFVDKQADFLGASLLPIIIDASIIFFVRVISTAGMAKLPKRLATLALVIPITASAWINFSASPNSTIGWVYVVVIVLVAVIETVKAMIKPDPQEMRDQENKITVAAAETALVDEDLAASRRASALKAAETRRERKAEREAKAEAQRQARRERAAAKRLEELAPTSPGHPAVILSASDKEALKGLMAA